MSDSEDLNRAIGQRSDMGSWEVIEVLDWATLDTVAWVGPMVSRIEGKC